MGSSYRISGKGGQSANQDCASSSDCDSDDNVGRSHAFQMASSGTTKGDVKPLSDINQLQVRDEVHSPITAKARQQQLLLNCSKEEGKKLSKNKRRKK